MGCALYETLGLDCWSGPRCADCPSADEPDDWDEQEEMISAELASRVASRERQADD